jgi:hypothetical protein
MKKSTDPYDKLRSALGDKPLPKGTLSAPTGRFRVRGFDLLEHGKLLEVPDGGAIEYDYCLVERSISDPLSHLRLRQSVSGRFVK